MSMKERLRTAINNHLMAEPSENRIDVAIVTFNEAIRRPIFTERDALIDVIINDQRALVQEILDICREIKAQ